MTRLKFIIVHFIVESTTIDHLQYFRQEIGSRTWNLELSFPLTFIKRNYIDSHDNDYK